MWKVEDVNGLRDLTKATSSQRAGAGTWLLLATHSKMWEREIEGITVKPKGVRI